MLQSLLDSSAVSKQDSLDTAISTLRVSYENLWWYEKICFPRELWSALSTWEPEVPEKTLRVLNATFLLSTSKSWYASILIFATNPFVKVCEELNNAGLLEGEQGLSNINSVISHDNPRALLWVLKAHNLQSRLTQDHFNAAICRRASKLISAPLVPYLLSKASTIDSTMSRIYNIRDIREVRDSRLPQQEIAVTSTKAKTHTFSSKEVSPKGDSPLLGVDHVDLEIMGLNPRALSHSPAENTSVYLEEKGPSPLFLNTRFFTFDNGCSTLRTSEGAQEGSCQVYAPG